MNRRENSSGASTTGILARARDAFARRGSLILLAVFPLLLIVINSNWIFTPIYSLATHDPWFYTAYLRHYFELAPVYPSNAHYFAERLAWLIPGHFVYRLLPHLAANYVLHLAVYYVGVAALYGILAKLSHRRVALLSALSMGAYPWFLRAAGWDYPDGAGIAQMLAMLFLLTLAGEASGRRPLLLFLAGALCSTLLSTQLFWVGLMPGAALHFLLLSRREGQLRARHLWAFGAYFLAGSLVTAGFLALIHRASSGSYNFLENSLRVSGAFSGLRRLRAENMYTYGAHPPFHNIVPILLAIASSFRLLRSRGAPREYALLAAIGNFALSYGFLVLINGATVYPVLYMYPYTSYLIPSAFVLFGMLIEASIRNCSRAVYACAVGFALLLQPLTLALSVWLPGILKLQGNWPLVVILSGLFLYGISSIGARGGLCVTLVSLWAIGFLGARQASVFISDPLLGKKGYLAVMDAGDAIDAEYPHPAYGDVRFWPLWTDDIMAYLAVEALYLYPWGLGIESDPGASYEWPSTAEVRDGAVVLIAADPNPITTFENAAAAVKAADADLELSGHRRIQQGDISLTLVFTQLHSNPVSLEYGERFEFDQPVRGTNMYPRETGSQGETYVWTGPGTASDLRFNIAPPLQDVEIRLCARSALRPRIARSLRLMVNSVPVPTTLQTNSAGCPWLYTGTIPASAVSGDAEATTLTIEVGRTVEPDKLGINPDDHRSLGLALDWIEIR